MNYWDTSVLLKLFVEEDDSRVFATLMAESAEGIHTSELSRLELLRAFWGKRLDEAIVPGAEQMLMRRFDREVEMRRIILVPLGGDVREKFETVLRVCYRRPRPIRVRTFDALHLASALACKAEEIVCTDRRMREAATALRMEIHPQKSS
jgi:predicted nucleic acid-binding protein